MWLKTNAMQICFILLLFHLCFLNTKDITLTLPDSIPDNHVSSETNHTTTIIPDPEPEPIATPEDLQNASNLADALSKILDIINADTPVTKDLKKLLDASKTIGLILFKTFNETNVKKLILNDDLKIARKRLIMKLEYDSYIYDDFDGISTDFQASF
uniref:Uncharacterized protein n=1 Tax=Panagrolaimus sp. PS1159 TaxID=55785 RepID=A0AC35F8C7_9BILA